MAAVFDGESLEKQFREEELEKQHQLVADNIGAMLAEAHYIEMGDYGNIEKQAGRKLAGPEFERRVKQLNPNLVFKARTLGTTPEARLSGQSECEFLLVPDGSVIKYLVLPLNGDETPIAAYTNTPMLNEFDIVLLKEEIISKAVPRYGKANMLTDLPKYDVSYDNGFPQVNFHGINNLQQRVLVPNGRVVGWRSILFMAIEKGALTLEAVEREFDSADRETWAAKTGKQALTVEI